MDFDTLLWYINNGIYGLQAITALYGVFCVVLLFRRIAQKRFKTAARAEEFIEQSRGFLQQRKFDDLTALCDSPPYWSKAIPQLILVALAQRGMELGKLKRTLAEKFERDVLSDLSYRMSWVTTIVKTAPMLGLLGTVTGMIGAFAKISAASRESGVDPSQLAEEISFALFTTAIGLMVAIPLVMIQASIHVRIGRLQDQVQYYLGQFFDDFEAATTDTRPRR